MSKILTLKINIANLQTFSFVPTFKILVRENKRSLTI